MGSDAIREAVVGDVPATHAMYAAWECEGITAGFCADSEECIARRLGGM